MDGDWDEGKGRVYTGVMVGGVGILWAMALHSGGVERLSEAV